MSRTIVERIAEAHIAGGTAGAGRPVRAGDFVTLRPVHVLTHDNSSAVIEKFRARGGSSVFCPRQPIFALDHDIQNKSPSNLKKYAKIEEFAREQGIVCYPPGAGIGHQLMLERGHVRPGELVVAADSHANIYGALGALGTPLVRADAAEIWARGTFVWRIPPTIQVVLRGALRPGVSGKDVILALCGRYREGEVHNAALEFAGPGLAALDMDARMTIANMTTEWGAIAAWFPVDETTRAYLAHRRPAALEVEERPAVDLRPDEGAAYAGRITLDLESVTHEVAGPDNLRPAARPLAVRVHKAYLLSCANARAGDLSAAVAAMEGKPVAPGTTLYVAAASEEVEAQARASGDWQALLDASAVVLPAGCGPCIGLGEGLLSPGEVGISASPRNFKGRMGSREAKCYLASPAVVAASAVAGRICLPGDAARDPRPEGSRPHLSTTFTVSSPSSEGGAVSTAAPRQRGGRSSGRLIFLPRADIDTDQIFGRRYLYRDTLGPRAMGRVAMENYDPGFARRVREGDVLVAGPRFGVGSSREQAVTALLAGGVRAVVAGSFGPTFERNALHHGLMCLESPMLVRELFAHYADAITRGGRTLVGAGRGRRVVIDLRRREITWRRRIFACVVRTI